MSGSGVSGLPALPGRLTSSPNSRLRRVRPLAGILPRLGVSISRSEQGKVSVCLPAEMAELFLLDLDQRAREWEAAMRTARLQEREHNAELKAATGEARRRWEGRQTSWLEEYERLRAKGSGHREALHLLRGPRDRNAVTVTDIELGIEEARARRRHHHREARNAEMIRLAGEGLSRQAIADALRVSHNLVFVVLKKVGIPVRDARHDRRGAIGAPR